MQLTKFTHACVRIDDGERRLVIDPGVFSEVEAALDGVDQILITHEHADHVDVERLRRAAEQNSSLRVHGPAGVLAALGGMKDQFVPVGPGETFEVAGFSVSTFGGQHALIHPAIPVVSNVAYLIDELVYHPGDSFTVPEQPVQCLLLPTNAPWSKAAEVIDFAVAVRAPQVFQIHDSLITDAYANIVESHIQRIANPFGVTFRHLQTTQTVSL